MPNPTSSPRSAVQAALVGALCLASGMGIGRFAFTPLLPLMQDAGLSLPHGAWLASINYAGYLAGALLCAAWPLPAGVVGRAGLLATALTTLAMGLGDDYRAWLLWRGLAGVASAWVLVGASSWALAELARRHRSAWSGWVFVGVGSGMMLAGGLGLVAGVRGWSAAAGWQLLGALAAAVALAAWRPLGDAAGLPAAAPRAAAPAGVFTRDAWILIACYGLFGYGYIIPATFLPALGRQLFPDPQVFGWAWPLFGLAGAVSTLVAMRWFTPVAPRRVFGWGLVLMAVGVAAPALAPGLGALLVCAACVGGTFMVVTMAGFQEARRVAGDGSARLVATMTAAFALGQLVGPLTVPAGPLSSVIIGPSLAAAAALLASAAVLLRPRARPLPVHP
jgi:MFS family permease